MPFTFQATALQDAQIITPKVFGDERGWFMETYQKDAFDQADISTTWLQDNHSMSNKWVLRWLHFQIHSTQGKLVRVMAGSVLDVIVDLRVGSSSYAQHIAVVLNATTKNQLYVPRWFAHGFLTLEDATEFIYKCDNIYAPQHDGGIKYDDVDLHIDRKHYQELYEIEKLIISEKDQHLPSFSHYKEHAHFTL